VPKVDYLVKANAKVLAVSEAESAWPLYRELWAPRALCRRNMRLTGRGLRVSMTFTIRVSRVFQAKILAARGGSACQAPGMGRADLLSEGRGI